MKLKSPSINILDFIHCPYYRAKNDKCTIIEPSPASGLWHITDASPFFIKGTLSLLSKANGAYPANLLSTIDYVFGLEPNTIEVCSRGVSNDKSVFTVDIDPFTNPTVCDDAQYLAKIPDEKFSRWRADPPYSQEAARKMYGCDMPDISKMLSAGARVVKPGSLLFLLLGPVNRQACPKNLKRVGWINCSCVPTNEQRNLHIYVKLE